MKRRVQENLVENFPIKCHRHSAAGDEAHASRHFIAYCVFGGESNQVRINLNTRYMAIRYARAEAKAGYADAGAEFKCMSIFGDCYACRQQYAVMASAKPTLWLGKGSVGC